MVDEETGKKDGIDPLCMTHKVRIVGPVSTLVIGRQRPFKKSRIQ